MKKFRIGAKHLRRISRFSADRSSASQPPPLQSVRWSLHFAMCHRAIGIRTARHTFPLWSSQRTWSGLLTGGLPLWVNSSILSCRLINCYSLAPEHAAYGLNGSITCLARPLQLRASPAGLFSLPAAFQGGLGLCKNRPGCQPVVRLEFCRHAPGAPGGVFRNRATHNRRQYFSSNVASSDAPPCRIGRPVSPAYPTRRSTAPYPRGS